MAPGSAGGGQVAGEARRAVALDQVPVRHHHGRGAGVGHGLDRGEGVPGPDAAGERAGAGPLDGDAVHHRVAVGHADLDQVDARRLVPRRSAPAAPRATSARRGSRRAGSRPARRGPGLDVGEERARAAADRGSQSPAAGLPPTRCSSTVWRRRAEPVPVVSRSNHLIAVSTSLSPRPDRLTRISGGCAVGRAAAARRPSLIAPASACADSMAGTMPSVRDSSAKASIASASVIGS